MVDGLGDLKIHVNLSLNISCLKSSTSYHLYRFTLVCNTGGRLFGLLNKSYN